MFGWWAARASPFGPSTLTTPFSTATFTPAGMATGCFPIRDIFTPQGFTGLQRPDRSPAWRFVFVGLAFHHAANEPDTRYDSTSHHTVHSISPPTLSFFASRSDITPLLVLRMAMPRPSSTRCTSL